MVYRYVLYRHGYHHVRACICRSSTRAISDYGLETGHLGKIEHHWAEPVAGICCCRDACNACVCVCVCVLSEGGREGGRWRKGERKEGRKTKGPLMGLGKEPRASVFTTSASAPAVPVANASVRLRGGVPVPVCVC